MHYRLEDTRSWQQRRIDRLLYHGAVFLLHSNNWESECMHVWCIGYELMVFCMGIITDVMVKSNCWWMTTKQMVVYSLPLGSRFCSKGVYYFLRLSTGRATSAGFSIALHWLVYGNSLYRDHKGVWADRFGGYIRILKLESNTLEVD